MNTIAKSRSAAAEASSLSWGTRLTRDRLLRKLAALDHGSIVIDDPDGTWRIGDNGLAEGLVAHVEVVDPEFYSSLATGGSIGAAESYIRGEWRSADLLKVMQVMAANVDLLNALDDSSSLIERFSLKALHLFNRNSKRGSRRNISAHYDLGNDFFSLFLDPTMMYSSAMFPEQSSSLEEASVHKLDQLCRKLELGPDDHLLEIGTGWGGMAEHAARNYGCRVTTTTISREQYEYACKRIEAAGLSDKVTLLMQDYRDLEGQFDKLVSIEMIEAVGHRYLPGFFRKCSLLLKPNGLFALQSILMPDQRYDRARYSVDFIQRYIFPGGFLPSNGAIAEHVGKQTDMHLVDIEDITLDYAKTLAAWRERFMARLDDISEIGFDEQFHRLWEYYFAYCEGGFRERAIGTAQFVMAKPAYRPSPL